MNATALSLSGVTKRFGEFTAVDGISLTVPAGAVYGFLGPNGAGKTTTIRMVMNIIRPDRGTITVLGQPSGEDVKERVGYLPEERGVYKKMRVLDLIAYFGGLKGLSAGESRERGLRMLEELELGKWARSRCQDLSKGMQQKVQFISTIIHEPELLILDEPFSGLDPVNTESLKDKILSLKAAGTTVLFSTHIMDQAEKLCDAVVLINRGRKLLDGPLADVISGGDAEEAVIVEYDGSADRMRDFPGVRRMNDLGKYLEVYLEPGVTPQDLLRSLVGEVTVRRFEVRRPTLHEVFVRSVRGDGDPPAAGVVVQEVTA
jgi:ABC-2 type transport system ATP-binding protein